MPEQQQLSHLLTWDSSWGVTGVRIGDFNHAMANSHGTGIQCAFCSLREEKQRPFSFAPSYTSERCEADECSGKPSSPQCVSACSELEICHTFPAASSSAIRGIGGPGCARAC